MIAIGHNPVATRFNLIAIRLGGNESARRHQPHFSPKPSAWRSQRGLNPSKTCLMSHNADVVLGAPLLTTLRLHPFRLRQLEGPPPATPDLGIGFDRGEINQHVERVSAVPDRNAAKHCRPPRSLLRIGVFLPAPVRLIDGSEIFAHGKAGSGAASGAIHCPQNYQLAPKFLIARG
jgi:hypothetical protein